MKKKKRQPQRIDPVGMDLEIRQLRDELKKIYARLNPLLRVKELQALPYDKYLKTQHWHKVRREAIEAQGGICRRCGSPESLNVHHLHYKTKGFEDPIRDLMLLCESCHINEHKAIRANGLTVSEEARAALIANRKKTRLIKN